MVEVSQQWGCAPHLGMTRVPDECGGALSPPPDGWGPEGLLWLARVAGALPHQPPSAQCCTLCPSFSPLSPFLETTAFAKDDWVPGAVRGEARLLLLFIPWSRKTHPCLRAFPLRSLQLLLLQHPAPLLTSGHSLRLPLREGSPLEANTPIPFPSPPLSWSLLSQISCVLLLVHTSHSLLPLKLKFPEDRNITPLLRWQCPGQSRLCGSGTWQQSSDTNAER